MSDYKDIKGLKVRYLASDPANPELGEVWYNSTTNVAKVLGLGTSSWATGGNLPTGTQSAAGWGIQTSAVNTTGNIPPNACTNATSEYNGTSWSGGTNYPAIRQGSGAFGASETSGVVFGGAIPTNNQPTFTWHNDTNEYDGSTWTSGGTYPQTITAVGASGILTAGLSASGTNTAPGAPGLTGLSAEYDGTSWTAVNSLNTTNDARHNRMWGVQNSSIASGQATPLPNIEAYDGTSWSTINTLSSARPGVGAGFGANSTEGVLVGSPPAGTEVESFDGTSWSSDTALPTGGAAQARAGTASLGLIIGGTQNPPNLTTTLEWTGAGPAVLTIGTD